MVAAVADMEVTMTISPAKDNERKLLCFDKVGRLILINVGFFKRNCPSLISSLHELVIEMAAV